jgi:hypothetical protein
MAVKYSSLRDTAAAFTFWEDEEGVASEYIEEYRQVFMSPLRQTLHFKNWIDAANFMKTWSMLFHVQWW